MDISSYEFNMHDLFRVDGRRQNRAFILSEVLVESLQSNDSKFSDILSKCPDYSILDALVYELLRLCVVRPEDYGRNSKVPKSSRQYQARPKTLKSNFSDRNFDYLIGVADHFGFSKQFHIDLMRLKQLVHEPDFKIRREVHSSNINLRTEHIGSIPIWVPPAKIRDVLFTYRWSLILGEYLECSRARSVEIYDTFIQHLRKHTRDCKDRGRKEVLDVISPCLPSELDVQRCLKRVADDLNKPWSIEFMHMDYAGLLKWESLADLSDRPKIIHFVADVLGAHILDARLVNGWSPMDERWAEFLTSQGNAGDRKLKQIYERSFEDDHAVEATLRTASRKYEKRWCAFDYLPKIHPDKYPKSCNLKLLSPVEVCESRLPIADVVPQID